MVNDFWIECSGLIRYLVLSVIFFSPLFFLEALQLAGIADCVKYDTSHLFSRFIVLQEGATLGQR